jgi:cysteine-rich repeat protein
MLRQSRGQNWRGRHCGGRLYRQGNREARGGGKGCLDKATAAGDCTDAGNQSALVQAAANVYLDGQVCALDPSNPGCATPIPTSTQTPVAAQTPIPTSTATPTPTPMPIGTPGCGDGVIQLGEQCDDGNGTAGDGCSATCTAEAPYEVEANDSTATANVLWPMTSLWKGSIAPVGDHDYFEFTMASTGTPVLVTHAADNPAACGFDTVIHLVNASGTQIVQDDDGGVGSCSRIDGTTYAQVQNLPAGTYYVWVQRYADAGTIPLYQLDLAIQ